VCVGLGGGRRGGGRVGVVLGKAYDTPKAEGGDTGGRRIDPSKLPALFDRLRSRMLYLRGPSAKTFF
jgi:hypothetical protein